MKTQIQKMNMQHLQNFPEEKIRKTAKGKWKIHNLSHYLQQASASEHDTMETLMEVPTRSQRRPRSRSPDSRRTRARTDSWTPPRTLWELFQRMNEDIPSQTFKQPLVSRE